LAGEGGTGVTAALFDHIRFQARLRPNALAVFGAAGPVAYHALLRDVDALATALLERELTRRDMVGIQLGLNYLHLLLILALDRLSIPSMSFALPDALPPATVVREQLAVTAIVSAHAAPIEPPCRWITMAEPHRPRFGVADAARLGRIDAPTDALVRVGWSSGTTGGAKGVPIRRSVQTCRLDARRLVRALGPRIRYFTSMPFSSAPGYAMPLAVLSAGGAVILPHPGTDFASLANALGVTMTDGSPSMLAELVGKPGSAPRRLETMELFMLAGAQASSQLAREARLLLTPHIWTGYGTTETDGAANVDTAVTQDDPSAVGHLFPWIDAQIVDRADQPLPVGQEGLLRLRSAQTVEGYYKNDAATRQNFRNGWFYPGDVGIITEQRLLRIVGRVEDQIMRAGVRISPLPLEDALRAVAGVRDVAVFPLTGSDGSQEICAALVLDPGTDADTVRAGAVARLGESAPSRMFRVEALPRNAVGKVLRRELVEWALQTKKG